VSDVDEDEKRRAEELFAECVPSLQERCDAGTATHNEYQMYANG
jgi:hypothetical protein